MVLEKGTMSLSLLRFLSFSVVCLGVFAEAKTVDEVCGYAPLCGQEDETFSWTDGQLPISGNLLFGAELSFEDCCSLRDTLPQQDCEIVNPTGESIRTLTSTEPLCGEDQELCQDGSCEEYQLVIQPTFVKDSQSDGCCDTCTCYGDPQCISFTGEEKMWVLCDGREIPDEDSMFDMCRITERRCLKEVDHAGNTCVYKAEDSKGRGWEVGKLGSPCVPSGDSPSSQITMYSVPDVDFNIDLVQGERGIIKSVYLTLSCGEFELEASMCLDDPANAWSVDGPDLNGELPEFFSYNDVVYGRDVHWSIVDPDSGIAISIRCHSNYYEGDPTHYVPRINVEDLADPVPRRPNTEGFCVTGDFDYGDATIDHTQSILDGDHCLQGLQESETRDIYRALCRNPALPTSAHLSCVYHFCSEYYLPLYSSIAECEATFESSLAEGFCRGVVYTENDVNKCTEQWFDLGAVETIHQYYDDEAGCTTQFQISLEKCQSGLVIQYFRSNQWNDAVAIPDDYCPDSDEIRLSYCDYPRLFNRVIRIVQKQANVACGPVNQCKTVDGFRGVVGLVKETPFPTEFPTEEPTEFPTEFPTPFPSLFPTEFPSVAPTGFPSSFPTVDFPTSFPTSFPTTNIEPPDCPQPPLCGTEEEYTEFDDESDSWHIDMAACCPQNACPPEVANPGYQERTKGTLQWYCGYSEGAEGTVEDSFIGAECVNEYELELMVMFAHDEDAECCKTCKCYGDPRCYSFDNDFEEFILCDGRTPGETTADRCVIRKETCEAQRDHEGNACRWYNPNKSPPDYSDEEKQQYEEKKYSVSMYGSPCQYDKDVSEVAVLLLYSTDDYVLEVEQGERGYIQTVYLEMLNGRFQMSAERCLNGDDWERDEGSELDNQFIRTTYGQEYVWEVSDQNTGINLRIRCTGTMIGNKYTTTFINVEALEEPDFDRIESATGFCAVGTFPEKRLATTEYTDLLREENYCDNWNEDVSEIMKREVARIITNNPGVTNLGVSTAYKQFCSTFFSPAWSSSGKCVSAFEDASKVKDVVYTFCQAVTREVGACQEYIELLAGEDGYKEAFQRGYEIYVVNYNEQCVVDLEDLPETLTQDDETCQTGAELQWYNPRIADWVTYAAFPDSGAPCSGYTVTVNYDDHPKLFKNPMRLVQRHDFEHCDSCTYASSVDGWFTFRQP